MEKIARHLPIDARTVVAVLLVLVLALVVQARIAMDLAEAGTRFGHALSLARLMTLPILLLLVLWLLGERRRFIYDRLALHRLTARVLLSGIAAGILMRMAAWSQLTAFGAFGLLDSALEAPARSFDIAFRCPSFAVMGAAILSWTVVVPLTEEVVHRGVVQSCLARHGKWAAIGGSTLLFTAMHEPGTYLWVALMGSIFALQYWNSRALWLPVVTHASYDSLVPLDDLCLQLAWNPPHAELPVLGIALPATGIFLCSALAAFGLSSESWARPR